MISGSALPPELDVDLAGLSAVAGTWFAKLPVSDQRVQSAPDGRTLRFYQSTGLLDRPLRYDGRVARYGRRHLLQLLAVRALQSQGHSLAQVQTSLAGASDDELAQTLNVALGSDVRRTLVSLAPATVSRPNAPVATAALVTTLATTSFVAAELAPGVVVTIDSRIHTDPARVIATLRGAIQGEEI